MEVYAIKLSKNIDRETVQRLLSFIEPEKQERVRRFYRWQDSLRTLFADLLIRHIIMNKTNLPNERISFASNTYGKPYLNSPADIHFNLSHSGIWVVCALDDKPIGIDVEEVTPIDLDISKNYFSTDEHLVLLSKEDKIDHFFTLWTLKESYIKTVGKGLSLPLNSFSMRFSSDNEIRIDAEGKTIQDIFFSQYDIDKKYKMAVCAHNKNFPGSIIPKTIGELVAAFLGNQSLFFYG